MAGSGAGLGAGLGQKLRVDLHSLEPLASPQLWAPRLFVPGVPAETTGGLMSPAATGDQMESWPLAPPYRPCLGAD